MPCWGMPFYKDATPTAFAQQTGIRLTTFERWRIGDVSRVFSSGAAILRAGAKSQDGLVPGAGSAAGCTSSIFAFCCIISMTFSFMIWS